MDRILVKDLRVRCTIGIGEEERREKQEVRISLALSTDLRAPGKSDRIEETVNYRDLKKRIMDLAERSEVRLIEALAERVAAICLEHPLVREAQVTVEKPGALRFARTVAVEIARRREGRSPRVFVGVGSNVEPEANVRRAIERLGREVRVRAVSTFCRTEPLGGSSGPPFVNGVVEIETGLEPLDLKRDVLRRIEEELGRRRSGDRWAPRTIDLDLLLFGDRVEASEDLVLPDAEVARRPFLAIPLFELAPDLALPGSGRPIREIAQAFADADMKPLPELTAALRSLVSL